MCLNSISIALCTGSVSWSAMQLRLRRQQLHREASPGIKTVASHKGGTRKIQENTDTLLDLTENIGFADFSPYRSWEPLDTLKRLSEGVRTFSALENLILKYYNNINKHKLRPWPNSLQIPTMYHNMNMVVLIFRDVDKKARGLYDHSPLSFALRSLLCVRQRRFMCWNNIIREHLRLKDPISEKSVSTLSNQGNIRKDVCVVL